MLEMCIRDRSGAIAGLPLIPGSATGLAMVTVVGQCMGAGEIKQAINYTKKLMLLACGSMGVICILMMIFLNPILGIYQLSADTMGIARVLLLSKDVYKRQVQKERVTLLDHNTALPKEMPLYTPETVFDDFLFALSHKGQGRLFSTKQALASTEAALLCQQSALEAQNL